MTGAYLSRSDWFRLNADASHASSSTLPNSKQAADRLYIELDVKPLAGRNKGTK